jgi:hypothetical protein
LSREQPPPAKKAIWTYAYQIAPPQSEPRLKAIKLLLEAEQAAARVRAGTFEARFVLEHQITDILVVTDSPDQDRAVNRRIASALDQMDVAFSVTVPLAVVEGDPSSS